MIDHMMTRGGRQTRPGWSISVFIGLALIVTVLSMPATGQDQRTGTFQVDMPQHQSFYWAHIPADADRQEPRPLLVCLHPSGGNGQGCMNRWAARCDRNEWWIIAVKSRHAERGGWGGDEQAPASIEETALALDALVSVAPSLGDDHVPNTTLTQAAEWIAHQTRDGTEHAPSPIGLYFASLWYYERLYPIIFAAGALRRLTQWSRRVQDSAEDADVF